MDKWQPIETAPKDGTEILVGADVACWGWRIELVYWVSKEGQWWTDSRGLHYSPTHWRHLPKPPKESE